MSGEADLVNGLVERLTRRLPHKTWPSVDHLHQDDVVMTTRVTLVDISTSSSGISVVLDSLLSLLENLAHRYSSLDAHPSHIIQSELYVLGLIADCCSSHWQYVVGNSDKSDSSRAVPDPMDDGLVARIFIVLKGLLRPIPDGYVLPSQTILDDISLRNVPIPGAASVPPGDIQPNDSSNGLADPPDMEAYIKVVVEYTTASSWSCCFDYFRNVIYSVRTATVTQSNQVQSTVSSYDERSALVVLRLMSFFWVDGQKLGTLIQELCSSFLHFRKSFQHTVAVVTPLLIIRWLDRFPREFVQLHTLRKRLDGNPDTLFDMTQTFADSGRRKALLYPLQTTLLFLLPDVFEVASNMRDAKGGSISKKVAFLDGLRKAMRNRNEQAGYCLVSLLRAARHFGGESDAAIVSYAMDVQDEVRDAVFRWASGSSDSQPFEQGMMTAAFVSLAHINLDGCIASLVPTCLHPLAPRSFKIAVVQGCCYFARQPEVTKYAGLVAAVVPFVQAQLKLASTTPMASASKGPDTDSPAYMIYNVLEFLDASPSSLFGSSSGRQTPAETLDSGGIFESFLKCIISPDESVQKLASRVAKTLFSDRYTLETLRSHGTFITRPLRIEFWMRSSFVLLGLCERLMPSRAAKPDFNPLRTYLESRLLVLSNVGELSELGNEVPDMIMASSRLETVLLVSLCSAELDTCQLITTCIGLFLEESRIVSAASEAGKSSTTLLRNADVFWEIVSPSFRFTGLVAFQKRNRGLLRRMPSPTAGVLGAWEAGFDRWIHLCKDVSMSAADSLEEKTFAEWRNYSGFLASLGGVCTADQASMQEDPGTSGLRWIDRLSPDNPEEPLLSRFLRLSIQLLACSNFKVREHMRDVLSFEISPSLYQALFKALESELEVLFAGALASPDKGQEGEIVFAEQVISLMRSLVDRLETPADFGAASSIHLGALALNFAKFLDSVADSTGTIRAKIKVCQLCEAITKRKEHLNLRDDFRIRNQLVEHIFSWTTRPRSPRTDYNYAGISRQDEASRVQRDLDRASLRSLAELTYRLPLQPAEGQADATSTDMKSQMFDAYFNRFLSILNSESRESVRVGDGDYASISEMAITILSNLLSANIDVGLKHSLSIGYHENPDIRSAFVKVLYNILIQGTEFSNLSDDSVMKKYEELLEVLTKDMTLACSMAAACPSNDVDELTVSLLTIFEHRGTSFQLLDGLVRQEIDETENESQILRRNCVATKMLSLYAKWKGSAYLKGTLQKVLERLMLTANDLDLELDPTRVASPEDLQKNAVQLKIVTKVFIDGICASESRIPDSFRVICNIISSAVVTRFPEAKYTAVGAFVFLRFFCPAIVAPKAEGLVTGMPSTNMRRGLLLIAKIVQNLANNVLFGTKEHYMVPLNDFLAENIYRVTTFLREVSAPLECVEVSRMNESFDFGSCVALNRFIYDYADQVRQKLLSQERRDYARSPSELARGRSPVLDSLRTLITKLGPPPFAVTWNRPQITNNNVLIYSRFQDFMLRQASRSNESIISSRAISDGSMSKDQLPVICMILRYIDTDGVDWNGMVFGHLKIASRMWHRPFGFFVDATCYNDHNQPPDEFFKAVELLAPSEYTLNLSRIYIYNMNSTFRKSFRRTLRNSTKTEHGVFSPRNVEYVLLGSLQELQVHFHLTQLHLPKETVSVVTDTRYVLQPVTKLSRTKGKVDVVIKVGGQFVQITTSEKQDIFSGFRLDTTINDIFRLGEVEEAPTSIQTEDDSAFGLRADSGKIVMYFTSPKKNEVLHAIRSAKAKYGKDNRGPKSFERLIRPQDVPGTLLNIAFTNLASSDGALRHVSYNLLGALCHVFNFEAGSRLVCARDVLPPPNPSSFIVDISKKLAESERQLTVDFLTEFFVGWDSFHPDQKPLSLGYMAPWLPGLRTGFLANEVDGEKAREKIAFVFRKLVEVATADPSLAFTFEQAVWPAIYQDEVLLEIFLDEVIKNAVASGAFSQRTHSLSSILASIGTVTLRGKIVARLRKTLNRSSLRPTKQLPENAVWSEVCVLLRFCLALSFDHGPQAQLFLPEVFHIVTMLSNTGSSDVRLVVYRLLVNTVHAACSSFILEDVKRDKLRASLDMLGEPRSSNDLLGTTSAVSWTSGPTPDSGPTLAGTESLAAMLFDICSYAAPSINTMNVWRSRWMSLVASTAFQNNPAIQPRAFAVMGCLARDEVDDDLLYQVLVALRHSLTRFGDDGNSDMMVAIMQSLSKMMAKLPSASRYGLQLFWLAISLLRLMPITLFNCAAQFLEAVLTNNSTATEFQGDRMVALLLQGRTQLQDAALMLDETYGVHFEQENFHFAVCACLARGLTDTATRSMTLKVLSSLLGLVKSSTRSPAGIETLRPDILSSPYLHLILSRASGSEELKDSLWLAGINVRTVSGLLETRGLQDLGELRDKDLLLSTAMELVDFHYMEDSVQSRTLQWLNQLALVRPGIILHLCGHIRGLLRSVLDGSENTSTVTSAHCLLRVMTSTPRFASALSGASSEVMNNLLADMGFEGLWAACSSRAIYEPDKDHFRLTERLIEASLI